MPEIYPFSEKGETYAEEDMERLGRRGRRAIELAEMKIPVVPGFVIDSRLTPELPSKDFSESLRRGLVGIEEGVGRKFGDAANPLLIKIVVSSNLSLPFYPTVFNVGLSPTTMPGFSTLIGEKAAWFEYCYLLRTIGTKIFDIAHERFDEIIARYSDDVEGMKKCAQEMVQLVGRDNVPDDPFQQFVVILKNLAKRYYNAEMDAEDPPALLVQGMVFGNLGEDSSVGMYYTRNIISGEDRLQGSFLLNSYTLDRQGQDILALDGEYLNRLQQIGRSIERKFRELREVKFIVEKKKLWIINQTEVDKKSTQAHIRTLLDLMKEGTVKDDWVVEQIPPGQLATLLHSVVDEESLAGIPAIRGGITGAPGAAVGRVFFNADRLMEAHRDAIQKGEDTRMVLVVTASYAEDVKAIEVGQGVISAEGGYSSHAPVVSRSLGKVSIVHPDIRIGDRFFEYNGVRVNEGDYVTMDAPVYRDPTMYTGKAKLISPDIHTNGLTDFIEVVRRFIKDDFVVRANADLGRDAKVARTMGAFGIGLCRTEHMFFAEDRIQRFREMILSSSYDERVRVLDDLRPLQRGDFYDLFKIMAPYPVTIRLLDAPLHEFLPRNDEALTEYLEYLQNKGVKPEKAEIQERIERLHEFNPMLGHRGCRLTITYPEILDMQVTAIIEAAVEVSKAGKKVFPEIMIPLTIDRKELKILVDQTRGVADAIIAKAKSRIKYMVGTMIEIPRAALLADEIAEVAEFFSFGTNDLTQMTLGLSRDDAGRFLPDYVMAEKEGGKEIFAIDPFV
ncbi:MAG: pyruvate, phosphate dikinase, partial [Spirochaetae bacterium HGW-Spirochaetae-10]